RRSGLTGAWHEGLVAVVCLAAFDEGMHGRDARARSIPQKARLPDLAVGQEVLAQTKAFRPWRRPVGYDGDAEPAVDERCDGIQRVEFQPFPHLDAVLPQIAIDDLAAPLVAIVADEGHLLEHGTW